MRNAHTVTPGLQVGDVGPDFSLPDQTARAGISRR